MRSKWHSVLEQRASEGAEARAYFPSPVFAEPVSPVFDADRLPGFGIQPISCATLNKARLNKPPIIRQMIASSNPSMLVINRVRKAATKPAIDSTTNTAQTAARLTLSRRIGIVRVT